MNICLLCASFLPQIGGMEFVIHNLANALVKQGHEVTVFAQRVSWKSPIEERLYQLIRYSIPVRGGGYLGLDYCSAVSSVCVYNLMHHFDVINCHGISYAGTRGRVISKLIGLPLVMTPHGEDVQKVPSIGYGLRLKDSWDRIICKNLKAADYVTAISKSIHGDLDCVSEEKIIDVSNGIHVTRFSGEKSVYLRNILGISESTKIILSVGRNHIKKGYVYGIEAVSKLVNRFGCKNVHYVIAGRGVSEHQSLVDECNAREYISLIEEMPSGKITQCYKSADVFFSPSIVEGFSLVSIEAMASGLPLVVTDVPGNDDVVRDNGCGVIVKSKDAEAMAAGLYRLLSDDTYRSSLAALSQQCSGKYDWSKIAVQYETVYLRAIHDHDNTETRDS